MPLAWRRTVLWALLHPREAARVAWEILELEAEAASLVLVPRIVVVDERRRPATSDKDKRWN